MRLCLRASRRLLCAALAATAGWAAPTRAEPLQPWQMVRSLQLVQDRIADGDKAALPIQRKLLEMIDARLRAATPEELAEPRNWDAVMVYATAGGNPATVKALMPDLLAAADAASAKADAATKAGSDEEAEGGHAEEGAETEAAAGEHSEETGDAEPMHATQDEASGKAGHATEEGHLAAAGDGETNKAETVEAAGHGQPASESASVPAVEQGGGPAQHQATTEDHGAGGAEPIKAEHGEEQSDGHGGEKQATDPVVTHSTEKPSGHEGGEETSSQGEAAHGEGDGKEGAAAKDDAPQPQSRDLALGVYNYGRGREPDAARALAKIDPMRERPELGAFVALIKGSLAAKADPAGALKLFDRARLIAPGTLVEEAALRRSIGLAIGVKDRARFLLASSQYVRRFLRSPYASQFADAFVAGVIALNEGMNLRAVADITADMAPEQERVVYLRIARQAGIDNLMTLSAFASAKANAKPEEVAGQADPRTALYAALSEVTGEKTGDTLARLDELDTKRLTASDRELLEAVKAVAVGTLSPPAALSPVAAPEPEDASLPALEPVPGEPVRPEEAGEQAGTATEASSEPASLPLPATDAVDEKMAATRKALTDVDKMLGDADK